MLWKREESYDRQVTINHLLPVRLLRKQENQSIRFINREEREENREWKQQDQIICIKNWEFQKRYTTSGRR